MRIVILGAGPTGLGAAYRLHQIGHDDWELWEQDTEVGGLSRSEVDEHGFTWDLGGHVQFSHYSRFDALMDQALGDGGWLDHERESWIRILGTWVPYPFQYNIHRLPREALLRCMRGLLALPREGSAPPARDFETFIRASFGEGISELFMLPYNRKVWAYPPAELASHWIGDRVAIPDLAHIMESVIMGKDNLSWGPNNTFRFPKRGGTGSVWRAVAAGLPAERLHLGRGAAHIDTRAHTVTAADGTTTHYDALISTLPLDVLIEIAGLAELRPVAAALMYSSVHVIGVGLHGRPPQEIATKCWMYFPESNSPFYRVTLFSNYSPNNVPDIERYWSLMAEVSESPVKKVDAARLEEDTIAGFLATGLIERREQVHHVWQRRIERGYPTPGLKRDAALDELLPALERLGIYSRGRFGAWKYEVSNQDHSMMQGFEAVGHILYDAPEMTLWFPGVVNRLHPVYGKAWL
jgi:protoporphyrinogen oxidase